MIVHMDVLPVLLENEPPEKRVQTWLEQCDFTCAHFENAVQGPDEEIRSHEGKFYSDLREKKKEDTRKVVSESKCRESFSSESDCLATSLGGRSYSVEESKKIVNYIVENDVFPFIKGNLLWQRMESEKVCNRTWQSMKSQFMSKIYPRINSFSVQKEEREKFDLIMNSSKQKKKKYLHLEPGQRGWRKNGNYYTESEDLLILNYILQKRRYLHVHGNSLWQTMEEKKVLPARTWQSMRSRYLNTIRHSLKKYKLQESDSKKIKNAVKNKKELKECQPHHQHSNQRTILDKKVQQNIRKYAVVASIKLASNLEKSKKVKKTVRSPEKTVHFSAPFLSDLETGSSETQEYVQNNSTKRNSKNSSLSGNGTQVDATSNSRVETSNYVNDNSVQACVEESVSKQNLECDSVTSRIATKVCVDNNLPLRNISFPNDACGEKVQGNVEDNIPVRNLENASDASSNGKQMDVDKLPLIESSKYTCDLLINEQPCIESNSFLEISKSSSNISQTQEYVENNSKKKNLINNDVLDNDTLADMESNPGIPVSKCSNDTSGNEAQNHVEKIFPQIDQDVSENHNLLQNTCRTSSCNSMLQENAVCSKTVEKFCDDTKMSGEAEEEEMSSNQALHCDEAEYEDSSSIFSQETVELNYPKFTNTKYSLDCGKCSLDHKLSPSSN